MIRASVTSCAVMLSCMDQPTTRRANRSMTTATYSHPSLVHTYVTSATQRPITQQETGAHVGANARIGLGVRTLRTHQPRIEATARHAERLTQDLDRPRRSVLHHNAEFHIDSLAKYAAAF